MPNMHGIYSKAASCGQVVLLYLFRLLRSASYHVRSFCIMKDDLSTPVVSRLLYTV